MPLLRFLHRRSFVVLSVLCLLVSTAAMRAQNFLTVPTTAVGSTSATQTATVKITAAGQAASIAAIVPGSYTLDYQILAGGTCAVTTSYTVGQTCTVKFVFKPTLPWTRNGAVAVYDPLGNVLGNTYLVGVGTGPQVSYPLSALAPVGSGISYPNGVAVDAFGNMYVTDYFNNAVKVISAANGSVTTLITLPGSPTGIAIDGGGNLYVTEVPPENLVVEIEAFNGTVSTSSKTRTVVSGLNNPNAVAVDGGGNLYIADLGTGTVKQVLAVNGVIPATPTVVSLAAGTFVDPFGLAVDPSGNVYVADAYYPSLKKIVAVGGTVSGASSVVSLGSGFNALLGVAVDMLGDVYAFDYGAGNVYKLLAVGGAVPTGTATSVPLLGSGAAPLSLAVDAQGDVYIADELTGMVGELSTQTRPSLSFASTMIGATSSDSPKTVTVQNIGNAALIYPAPGTIGALNPSISASFVYSGSSTCAQIGSTSSGFTLASAALCTEIVSFVPATSGAITGSLVSTDNSLNASAATQSVALSGTATGYPASISVTAASIAYGTSPTTLTASLTYGGPKPTGAVTFQVDSGTTVTGICTGTASPLSCSASYSTGTLTVSGSPHTIAVSLAADSSYALTSGNGSLTVTTQTPAVTVSPVSISYGASPTTLTASVAFAGSGAVPSGAVTIKVDAGVVVTASCSGTTSPRTCTASYTTSALTVAGSPHTITASLAADANYAAASNTAALTVTAQTPTVTVSTPAAISYGTATTTLSATVAFTGAGSLPSGAFTFQVGSGTTVTASCTGATSPRTCTASYNTAALTVAGSAYTVTGTLASDANYTAASNTAVLTVNAQTPGITVTASSISYGTATATLTAKLTFTGAGALPSGAFTFTVDGGTATAATCAGTTSPLTCTATFNSAALSPGAHAVVASLASDGNYNAVSNTGTLTVTAVTPTVAVTPAAATYGAAATTLTAKLTFTGSGALPSGAVTFQVDTGVVVTGSCTGTASPLTCTASYTTSLLSVGAHTITVAAAADANYNAASNRGTLTVTAQTPRLIVSPVSVAYASTTTTLTVNVTFTGAGAVPTGAVTVKVNGGTAVTATCTGTASPLVCTATYNPSTLSVGGYTIAAAITADANYNAATGNGTLTVTAIAPTIIFTVPNHTYGDAPFTVAATSNSTGAFTYSVVSGPATVAGSTVTLTGAGTVVLQASQAANGNYTAGTQQATFTVAMAVPAISFAVPNHTYGDAPFTVSATSNSTGAIAFSLVSGPATVAGSTVTITGAGQVCLLASEAADANYLAGTQQACFTVSQAAQTINVASIATQVTFGNPPIALSAVASSGLAVTYKYVSGPASVNGSTLTITGAGTVVITASQVGNVNYLAAPTVTVTITVLKATPVVMWTTPATIGYGTALSATQLDAVVTGVGGATLAGSPVYTPGAGAILAVGAQTLNMTFTPTDTADYTTGAGVTTLIVGRGTPSLTITASVATIFVQNSVTFTATVTSPGVAATGIVDFVDGTNVIGAGTITNGMATFATTALAVGTHTITAVYTGDTNYGSVTSTTAVMELVEDFTLTAATAVQTVALGGNVGYPLTVTPVGGATMASAVSFTVSGLPAGATVSFSPASIAAGAGATNVTMTIVAPTALAKLERGRGPGAGRELSYASLVLALLLLPFGGRLRRRAGRLSRMAWLGLLLLGSAAGAMGLSGCSGTTPTTPTETFVLTVNATSGTLIHSTTVTLTVQ